MAELTKKNPDSKLKPTKDVRVKVEKAALVYILDFQGEKNQEFTK